MTHSDKKTQFAWDAVHKQLDIAGHPHDVIKDEWWFSNNTMTEDQYKEWKDWFLTEGKKQFKWSKKTAEIEFQWFDLQYGLKIS